MTAALLFHPATQHSFHLARELASTGRLSEFHTGIALPKGTWLDHAVRTLPAQIASRLSNRRLSGVSPDKIHLHPAAELKSLAKQWIQGGASEAILHTRNLEFQRSISTRSLARADAVIGFDTSSWLVAERCRELSKPFILDQSIGHPDSKELVYKALQDKYPEWGASVTGRLRAVRRAEQTEHELAKIVVAASSFTARTLVANGVPLEKIRINPYGVDSKDFALREPRQSGPFRFAFVGSVTARKGTPLLLEAWRRMRSSTAELWLIGPVSETLSPLVANEPNVRTWGAVPHTRVPELLRQCDAFVLPSYFEGFGLVICEAMACGLPVIATDSTAAPDLYTHGDAGWIFPTGDLEKLVTFLDECVAHPQRTRAMGRQARTIAETQTWDAYGKRWINILDEVAHPNTSNKSA